LNINDANSKYQDEINKIKGEYEFDKEKYENKINDYKNENKSFIYLLIYFKLKSIERPNLD